MTAYGPNDLFELNFPPSERPEFLWHEVIKLGGEILFNGREENHLWPKQSPIYGIDRDMVYDYLHEPVQAHLEDLAILLFMEDTQQTQYLFAITGDDGLKMLENQEPKKELLLATLVRWDQISHLVR
jgi:hypothetical protein